MKRNNKLKGRRNRLHKQPPILILRYDQFDNAEREHIISQLRRDSPKGIEWMLISRQTDIQVINAPSGKRIRIMP